MQTLGGWHELGHGHAMKLVTVDGRVVGGVLKHPVLGTYAEGNEYPECEPGLVQWEPTDSTMRPIFTLESGEGRPVSLSPFIVCSVCGDKGWIVGGKWHPKDDEDGMGTQPPMQVVEGVEGEGDEVHTYEPVVRRDLGDRVPEEEHDADRRLIDVSGHGKDEIVDGAEAEAEAEAQAAMRAGLKEGDGPLRFGPETPTYVANDDDGYEDVLIDGGAHDHRPEKTMAWTGGYAVPKDEADPELLRLLAEEDEIERRLQHAPEYDAAFGEESLRRSLLDEALGLITGDRNNAYGPPHQDFQRTAEMVTAMWKDKLRPGAVVEAHDVAQFVICIKLSRLQWSPMKRDNWTDIVGYAGCGYEAFRLTHPETEET